MATRAELQKAVDDSSVAAQKARMAWKAARTEWAQIEKDHNGDVPEGLVAAKGEDESIAEKAYVSAKGQRKKAERALAAFDAENTEVFSEPAPEPEPEYKPLPKPDRGSAEWQKANPQHQGGYASDLDKKWAVYIAGDRALTDKAWADEIAGPRPAGWGE